jgi:hypothetical protein
MAWDFSTDPEYQRKLDWARDFVRTQKDRPLAGVRVVQLLDPASLVIERYGPSPRPADRFVTSP